MPLRKLDAGYDPRDRISAMNIIQQRHAQGEVVTGLLYVDPAPATSTDIWIPSRRR